MSANSGAGARSGRALYTKRGDAGTTDTNGRGRVSKTDPIIEAVGTLDEASAFIGMCYGPSDQRYAETLKNVQCRFLDIGTIIASRSGRLPSGMIDWLKGNGRTRTVD